MGIRQSHGHSRWQSRPTTNDGPSHDWVDRLTALRQHQHNGKRAPHKPLLLLVTLGRLAETGSSEMPGSDVEERLADLIAEFGPVTRIGRRQSAAYPFTHLRTRCSPVDRFQRRTRRNVGAPYRGRSRSSKPGIANAHSADSTGNLVRPRWVLRLRTFGGST